MDAGAAAPSAAGRGAATGTAAYNRAPTRLRNDAPSPRSDVKTIISLSDVRGM